MNLTDLQAFLGNPEIPVVKKVPKTFLEIARQPHYENVISNIYAFLFNVQEDHGLNDLFIKSLIECINDFKLKGKDFSSFSVFDIDTEHRFCLLPPFATYSIPIRTMFWINES